METNERCIILFKGDVQYDATNRFIEDMEEGFKLHGQSYKTFDLKNNFTETRNGLIKLIEKGRPFFALGINAMGQFYIGDKSIYDLVKFPHVSWFVDHPVHHIERLELPVDPQFRQDHLADNFGFVGVVDEEHKKFVDAGLGNKYGCIFIPHGCCSSLENQDKERKIDIIFCGSGFSPELIRENWENTDCRLQELFNLAIEIDTSEQH